VEAKIRNPSFLATPDRPAKPRHVGVTHVLDKGLPLGEAEAILASAATYIDIWKFGWGTAYLDRELGAKIELLNKYSVLSCTGGTLLEIAWVQEKTDAFFDWIVEEGFDCVEVSNGATGLPISAKRRLMAEARDRGLIVLSEVGSKDPDAHVTASAWVEEIVGDVTAGARWVVAEGRESGTVGLYDPDGEIRIDLLDAIENSVDVGRMIYEAPRRHQQARLIRVVGPGVNLGNVATGDIISVESLRVGLRADTIGVASVVMR